MLTPLGAAAAQGYGPLYREFADWQAVYGGLAVGDIVRQAPLARLIETLAADGPDAYYRGPVAADIEAALGRLGGLLTTEDLAAHVGTWEHPLRCTYRDVEVAELPPPTQGVAALEILRILDGFDLARLDPGARAHLVIEAVKIGLRDRDDHVSDPGAMPVTPADLLSEGWISTRRDAIDPDRATAPSPGHPQRGGTAYLCAADGDGLLVSLIQSNFLAFGSGVHVPEWGINLNNRGSSFALDASRTNALAPAKLPMHTLIPAMVLRRGVPDLVFGTMGGDAQAQVHAQLLTAIVDDGADPQAAIDAPRWRVEPWDWRVRTEAGFDRAVLEGLVSRGHQLVGVGALDSGMGHAHAIRPAAPGYAVATDPRAEGAAVGL